MRVAFLSDWWLPTTGGAERYMIDLGAHLRAQGHEVVVLHSVTPGSDLPERESPEGLPTIRMPLPLSRDVAERCGLLTAQAHAVAAVLESIWPGGPDLLHGHSNWMGMRTLLAGQLLNRPAVVSLHVNWPLTPTVQCLRTCVGYEESVCAAAPIHTSPMPLPWCAKPVGRADCWPTPQPSSPPPARSAIARWRHSRLTRPACT